MTANSPKVRGHAAVGFGLRAILLGLAGMLAANAQAANTLRDIQFAAEASGEVQVTLQLDGPAGDASVFTTDDPPRIAIDLPETLNAVEKRRIAVGAGAASTITAVEANGRTRVVIDLFRASSFESRAEANRFILTIGAAGGGGVAAQVAAASSQNDPSKQTPATNAVNNVDFRRGENGGGRVIVALSNENQPADYNDSGEGVTVSFSGATVSDALAQRLDVRDFATPVEMVELSQGNAGARLRISASGNYRASAYQSGTEYVVELTPIAETEGQGGVGIGVLDEAKTYEGTPVTFNFQNIPVRTVLQLVAEESGLNVVAADTVTGNVTLRLINVPWDSKSFCARRALISAGRAMWSGWRRRPNWRLTNRPRPMHDWRWSSGLSW